MFTNIKKKQEKVLFIVLKFESFINEGSIGYWAKMQPGLHISFFEQLELASKLSSTGKVCAVYKTLRHLGLKLDICFNYNNTVVYYSCHWVKCNYCYRCIGNLSTTPIRLIGTY